MILSDNQRDFKTSSLHGDLSDKRKVKTVTLVDIVQPVINRFVLLVVFSGCGLPGQPKPTFKESENSLDQN